MATGDPLILASARRHHIDDRHITVSDILHAYRNPIRVTVQDDIRIIVGASRSGLLLEIGIVKSNGPNLIVHAMRARRKYLGP